MCIACSHTGKLASDEPSRSRYIGLICLCSETDSLVCTTAMEVRASEFCCSCIMASYIWSVEDSNIIQENITFLENEITRSKRLRDNGPMGERWLKQLKISAQVLNGPDRKQ